MPHFAVSAIGLDRPGIVAAVTGFLLDQGCNLEDSSMSVLRGHFAMMLVVAGPDTLTAGALEADFSGTAADLDLVVAVRAIDDSVPPPLPGERWTVAVYGADRPGIVHDVAELLAARSINVVDLTTHLIGDSDRPVYAMVLEVTVPSGIDGDEISGALAAAGRDLGVDCSMHRADADVL